MAVFSLDRNDEIEVDKKLFVDGYNILAAIVHNDQPSSDLVRFVRFCLTS